MEAIEFPEQSYVIGKDQPEYIPLPVYANCEPVDWKDEKGNDHTTMVPMELTACFRLSPEEIAQVNATGKLWYTQCVFGGKFHPVKMSMLNPFRIHLKSVAKDEAKVRGKDVYTIDLAANNIPLKRQDIWDTLLEKPIVIDGRDAIVKGISFFALPDHADHSSIGVMVDYAHKAVEKKLPPALDREIQEEIVNAYEAGKFSMRDATLTIYKRLRDKILSYIGGGKQEPGPSKPVDLTNSFITTETMEHLAYALRSDPEYREGWKANIAVAFSDAFNDYSCKYGRSAAASKSGLHEISNIAADSFLAKLTKQVG